MASLQYLQALDLAQKDKSFPQHVPLYVCFNPYFPDQPDLAAERRRLKQKLEQGGSLITGIYLQVSCNPHINPSSRSCLSAE